VLGEAGHPDGDGQPDPALRALAAEGSGGVARRTRAVRSAVSSSGLPALARRAWTASSLRGGWPGPRRGGWPARRPTTSPSSTMASRRESIPAVVGVAGILTSSRARVRSASRVLAASRCSSWRGPPHAGQDPGAEVAGPAEHPAVGRGHGQQEIVHTAGRSDTTSPDESVVCLFAVERSEAYRVRRSSPQSANYGCERPAPGSSWIGRFFAGGQFCPSHHAKRGGSRRAW
jgi:hypothetical protein